MDYPKFGFVEVCNHSRSELSVSPGPVGKSHFAVGLGLKAIEHGYRVLFATAAGLITAPTKAAAEGRLEEHLKVYTVPRPEHLWNSS